jgi:uncharacterized protein with HEPN domain
VQKDDFVYLEYMLETARKVVARVEGKSRAEFDANEDLRLAVAYLIQTIGEAARRVSPETSARYPEIPWSRMIGMRHKIVHDYAEVNEDIVWQVATRNLLQLIQVLEPILPPERADP